MTVGRPDGSDAKAYDHVRQLSHRDLAWEFLRRNPMFQPVAEAAADRVTEHRHRNLTILRLWRTAPSLKDWGLIHGGSAGPGRAGGAGHLGSGDLSCGHSGHG
jgi:hypothetical protein